jgi:hypothetical protein
MAAMPQSQRSRWCCGLFCFSWRAAQFADGSQNFPTIAQDNAKVFQVLIGKVRQD